MDLRSRVNAALKQAMKDKDSERVSTLRLINAAIKDKDIAARGSGAEEATGCDEKDVLAILGKMTKQRQESARAYEEGGRLDLAERETREVEIIAEFLPKQLDEDEVANAIQTAITATGAGSIRDMGKVMGELKSRYTGRMDFGKVGPMVKDHLCASSSGQC
ncbi:MAG: GatB/YqeY domain-containing protein [Paracoccaceae bacterium]